MATIGPFGYVGGLNANALAYELGKDQLSDGQDSQFVYGTLQKRKGSANINTSALNSSAAVTGLFDWLANAGTRYLLIVCGNKIYQTAALGNTPTDITGSATITAGANNQHTFASLNNIVVICGGATPDTPLQWTGSGNVGTLSGTPPVGNLCVTANNFVFISGVTATPSRVFWSSVSDPQTWPSASFIDFRQGDGDSITALADLNQNLIISKRRSIGLLYTQSLSISGTVTLGPLNQAVNGVGIAGSQCWDHLPDGRIVFLGSNAHVYIFDGSLLMDISDRPYPKTSFQANFDSLNINRIGNACVQTYSTRHQVWFSVSTGSNSTNNQVYVYDYFYDTWMPPFTNINANVLRSVVDTRSTPSHPIVICTGTYGGFVTEQDTGNTNVESNGNFIDGYGTVSIILGDDQTDFEPKSIIVPYEAQTTAGLLSINYGFNGFTETGQTQQVNMQATGAQLDVNFILDQSKLFGSLIQRTVIAITSPARTFSIQVSLRNQNGNQPFVVHPIFISDEVPT